MVVQVGVMELPVTEDPDDIQTYMNGEHLSGGLWTALTRASNHDHSGGLSGVQLGATSIPDGSITTAKLDPAVLLPYALTDGSKPFTGQVSMNADAIVRDTVYFGEQGSVLAPDATLSRTGAGALRVNDHLGVGVAPVAWASSQRAIQVGSAGVVFASLGTGNPQTVLGHNTAYLGGGSQSALHEAWPASDITQSNGSIALRTAPAVAAGATQTFTTRMALAPTGTLTLSPDAGQPALHANVGAGSEGLRATFVEGAGGTFTVKYAGGIGAGYTRIDSLVGGLALAGAGGYVLPAADNTYASGHASYRWTTLYAVAGTINTSSSDAKEALRPLSPAACYQAAKDVVWYEFAYLPPAYTEPEPPPEIAYDAADDNEAKAEKKALRDEAAAQAKAAHLKMVAETAPARNQRGFVFPDGAEAKDEAGGALPPVPDLFGLSDRESTTPGADVATLGCALQEIIRRLEALEEATA